MVAIILCSAIFFLMLIIFSHVFCLQALISIYTAKNSTGCYSVVTVLVLVVYGKCHSISLIVYIVYYTRDKILGVM